MSDFQIVSHNDIVTVDWQRLAEILERSGLGKRDVVKLQKAFNHSQFRYLGYYNGELVATARAISDLTSASYLCDVAIDPLYQGKGWGRILMEKIMEDLSPLGKTFIYSVPDKIKFYQQFDFHELLTAMIYVDQQTLPGMINAGYIAAE